MLYREARFAAAMVSIVVLAAGQCAGAQATAPPTNQAAAATRGNAESTRRPPLLFRETWTWRLPPTGFGQIPPAQRRVSQAVVGNPNLELRLYGTDARDITISSHEGRYDVWTGMTTSPVALTLRDKSNYIDLTGLARLRWMTRTESLHVIHPVIRLADGSLLVGSHADSSPAASLGEGDFVETEVTFDDERWFALDPDQVVTKREVKSPDLSRVDEIGFADLMPGGGIGGMGASNLSGIELFATAHKR